MKTLHLIGSRALGGAERWCFKLTRALHAQGEAVGIGIRQGSELTHLPWGTLRVTPLPLHTVWDPWSRWAVARWIRREQPALVQTYMGRATRLTRLEAGREPVHLARLGGYYKLDGYRHAHAWVANTLGLCDYLIEQGFPKQRVFHLYNFADPPRPVDPAELAALRASLGAGDEWLLLTPGRFVPVKGHPHLLEALARLPALMGGRRWRLILLGEGPLGESLRDQARRLALEDRLLWPGWQRDPAPWYALADLVVFPSLEMETFGNVVVETWSHGKPLVTTAFRGAREIVRNGVDARLVPCADPAALAQGIAEVLNDPAWARELAESGRLRLAKDFQRERILSDHLDLYRHLARV
ncbi:Glycosyltransferase [Gammaproteobacteria bacterium]